MRSSWCSIRCREVFHDSRRVNDLLRTMIRAVARGALATRASARSGTARGTSGSYDIRAPELLDAEVRIAAFDWLHRMVDELGDVLPRPLLLEGFGFRGARVPLVGPPASSSRSSCLASRSPSPPLRRAVRRRLRPGRLLAYRYRGTDPPTGQRRAARGDAPADALIYCHGIVPGRYLVTWPVFVSGRSDGADLLRGGGRARLADRAALDSCERPGPPRGRDTRASTSRPRSGSGCTSAPFASGCCSLSRRLRPLPPAPPRVARRGAHHPRLRAGREPVVTNGIALCALHHAAFDKLLIGVRPDYVVAVRTAILEEIDGPMLQHGSRPARAPARAAHDTRLRPDPDLLARRWERFKAVA